MLSNGHMFMHIVVSIHEGATEVLHGCDWAIEFLVTFATHT
jgi:hypothetical protein